MSELLPRMDLGDGVVLRVATDTTGAVLVADQDLRGGFEAVEAAIGKVGTSLKGAMLAIAPSKATVELGFNLSVEAGQLIAVLVGRASGSASITVTLEWAGSDDVPPTPAPSH